MGGGAGFTAAASPLLGCVVEPALLEPEQLKGKIVHSLLDLLFLAIVLRFMILDEFYVSLLEGVRVASGVGSSLMQRLIKTLDVS